MSRRVPHVFQKVGRRFTWVTDAPLPDPLPAGERGIAPGGRRVTGRQDLGGVGMGSDFFGHPQPRRAGAGVGRHLPLRWADRTAGDAAERWPVAAGAEWLLG